MNKVSEWINDNYKDLRKTILNITKNSRLVDDLMSECVLIFMEHEKAEGLVERGQAKWFFIRIVLNQYRSTTSSFYKNFRREREIPINEGLTISDTEEYDYDLDELIDLNINIIEDLLRSDIPTERYYGIMVMLYFSNGNNFAEVARCLGISRSTIRRQFDEASKLILQKMKVKDTGIEHNDLPLKILASKILEGYGKRRRF